MLGVGIPAWRACATIEETLDSLQCQRGLGVIREVLVIDDGSRDDVAGVVRRCWKASVPIHVESLPENRGQWFVTNRLLEKLGRHPWVVILHADDVLKQGWLEAINVSVSAAPARAATVCTHYDRWFAAEGRVEVQSELVDPRLAWFEGSRRSVGHTLSNGCWWHISGSAISSRAFHELGGFDARLPYSSDWDWLLRALAAGWSVGLYRESLMRYRTHGASVSSRSFALGLDISEAHEIRRRFLASSDLDGSAVAALRRRELGWCARRVVTRLARGEVGSALHHLALLARLGLGRVPVSSGG